MSDKLEIHGKTVENAVSEALLRMGARKDEVTVTVLEEPKSGFLGILGARQAKVLVERKAPRRGRGREDFREKDQDAIAHDLSGGQQSGRKRGRGSRGGRSGSRQGRPEQTQSGQPQADQTTTADRGRQGGGSRGGRKPAGDESRNQDRSGGRSGGQGSDSRNQGSDSRSQGSGRGRRGQSSRSNSRPGPEAAARPENFGNTMPAEGNETAGNTVDQGPREPRRGRHPRSNSDQPVRRGGGQESRGRSGRDENNRNSRNGQGGERAEQPDSSARAERAERPERSERPERGGRGRGRGSRNQESRNQDRDERTSNPSPNVEQVPDTMIVTGLKATSYAAAVRDVPEEALNDIVCDFTAGVLIRAGFPCRCEIKEGEYRQVRVTTGDEGAGMLIGRHGSTVDAVEHLIERMMGVAAGDRVRMNLDINNYRRRREDTLVERVAEAVARVKETERDYHMEPMCARERRLIHLETEQYEGIRTYTLMRSGDKHVVLALDKGEARESSAEDGSGEQDLAPAAASITSVEVSMDTSLESAPESASEPEDSPAEDSYNQENESSEETRDDG